MQACLIPIFGNGDIDSPQRAVEYKRRYGVDGLMIGRASIGYPWIFAEIKHFVHTGQVLPPPGLQARVGMARRHLAHALAWKGERTGLLEMRSYYARYFRGVVGSKPFRAQLVTAPTPAAVEEVLAHMAAELA